jgi:hypothetical protein
MPMTFCDMCGKKSQINTHYAAQYVTREESTKLWNELYTAKQNLDECRCFDGKVYRLPVRTKDLALIDKHADQGFADAFHGYKDTRSWSVW